MDEKPSAAPSPAVALPEEPARYNQMGSAMVPCHNSLTGKPSGAWIESKDYDSLRSALLRAREENSQLRKHILSPAVALPELPARWFVDFGSMIVKQMDCGGYVLFQDYDALRAYATALASEAERLRWERDEQFERANEWRTQSTKNCERAEQADFGWNKANEQRESWMTRAIQAESRLSALLSARGPGTLYARVKGIAEFAEKHCGYNPVDSVRGPETAIFETLNALEEENKRIVAAHKGVMAEADKREDDLRQQLKAAQEACAAALPRLAHKAACCSVRSTEEWPEHGSLSFENCCCEIVIVSAIVNAATASGGKDG